MEGGGISMHDSISRRGFLAGAAWQSGQASSPDLQPGTFVANTVNRDAKVPPDRVRALWETNPNYI